MKITHKIRTLNKYLPLLKEGTTIVCGLKPIQSHFAKLIKIGFLPDLKEGTSLLPDSGLGPVCRTNADGWTEIHKDQPMETFYTAIVWRWKQWRGRDDYDQKEEVRYRPGKRYPRTEHPPLGIEIVIRLCTDGSKIAILEFLEVVPKNYARIIASINILVEIFGECDLLNSDLDTIIKGDVKRLNWSVLPPGKHTWATVKESIKPILEREKPGAQQVIEKRIETVNHYEPTFTAVGIHGFLGYLIFGFPDKDLYLLESIFFGNATYILGQDWEHLSKLSKGEILSQGLLKERVIHREDWYQNIARLLS